MKHLYHLIKCITVLTFLFIPVNKCFSKQLIGKNPPKVWNVPIHNEYFTGRKEILKQITQTLKKGNVAIIAGISGIGKTQVAKKYAVINNEKYNIIWWFDVDKDLFDQFRILAEMINNTYIKQEEKIPVNTTPESIVEGVKNYLRLTNLKWLLIFDDSSNETKIKNFIPQKYNNIGGDIVITSKNLISWKGAMKLGKFSREESKEYLKKLLPSEDLKSLDKLAEILDDYPLALSQSVAYLKANQSIGLNGYIELFKSAKTSLWDKEQKLHEENNGLPDLDNYSGNVFTSLSISINDLKKKCPLAFDILVFCSTLNNEKIPEDFLQSLVEDKMKESRLEFTDALARLNNYMLIEKNKLVNKEEITTYSMHAIVQHVVQAMLSKDVKINNIRLAQQIISNKLPDQIEELAPLILSRPYIFDHLRTIATKSKELLVYTEDLAAMYIRQLEYDLLVTLDYDSCSRLIEEINNLINYDIKINGLLLAQFHHIKAIYHNWRFADSELSIQEANKALMLLKQYPERVSDHLNLYNQLAQFYIYQGDIDNADKYVNLAEVIIRSNHGIKAGLFNAVKAKVEMDKGNYRNALNLVTKAIDYEEVKDIREVPGEWPLFLLQAEVFLKAGRYSEAFDLSNKLYELANKYYKDTEHELIARILIVLSASAIKLSKLELAKNYIEKALYILRKILGDDAIDIDMANTLVILGEVNEKQHRYTEANEYYLMAELSFKQLFEDLRTDDISYLYYRLGINGIKSRNPFQFSQYLNLHKAKFGLLHHRTEKLIRYSVDNIKY